jgi:hypothetical protein
MTGCVCLRLHSLGQVSDIWHETCSYVFILKRCEQAVYLSTGAPLSGGPAGRDPFGGDLLAVEIDGRPLLAKRLAAIAGVRLHQDGDREKTFVFPVGLFEQVAEVVLPRRRRRLSPEQRVASEERLARYRFTGGTPGHQAGR